MMDIRKVKKLIDLLEQSSLAEIEIKEGEESIRICRAKTTPNITTPIITTNTPEVVPTPSVVMAQTETQTICSTKNAITSPMVGTFYASASPTSAPFITVGQIVKAGDVIGIIEAMKIMNQIETDKAGTVVEILCRDGDSIEFGQNLIIIE